MTTAIPSFYLYGEPRRIVDERFVHVESLDDRNRPSQWTIRPHVHAELNHIFHVVRGGGAMRVDSRTLDFAGPCLLLVPAGTVHGFQWKMESTGSVVTVASRYLADFVDRDPDLAAIFERPAIVPSARIDAEVTARLARLTQELGWAAPGYRSAAQQDLLGLLVLTLRQLGPRPDMPAPGPQAALVARLRERIDARFRLREPMESHAAALGVSPRRLREACARVAGQPPADMLDERAMLEAKRSLAYSNLSVAQVGYALGFADPSYFSRFFTRHEGLSPAAFRKGLQR